MIQLDEQAFEDLSRLNQLLKASGMAPMDDKPDEIRKNYQAIMSQVSSHPGGLVAPQGQQVGQPQGMMQTLQGPGGGLSPIASGVNLPISGFQGSNLFPNASGAATSPMADFDSRMNPQGQPMGGGMMGQQMGGQQPQLGGRGFTTNIQIGEDGQIQSLMLKRALQKKMQGMA